MRFSQERKNWEVPQGPNNKWIVFAMRLTDVTLKIWVIVVQILLGVTNRKGTIEFI